VIVRLAAPCRCVPLTANVMHQAADSLVWSVGSRASRRLLALWRANHRRCLSQAPRTAVGFGAAADRPPLDAPRSVSTLGSAVGSEFMAVSWPSLAVLCNGPVPSKSRFLLVSAPANLHRVLLVRRGITGPSTGRPKAALLGSLRCAPAPVTSNVSRHQIHHAHELRTY
jgi:hypothetical protein